MIIERQLKQIIPLLILVLSIQIFTSVTIAQDNTNKQVSQNVWNLTQWNQTNNPEWWPRGIYIHAQAGTQVSYTITSSQDNITNPNNGRFSIGNITGISTNNYDLAGEFALSIYPWSPGFVADPYNWTAQTALAHSGANTLSGTLNVTEGITNSTSFLRTSYTFVFNQSSSDVAQNTKLVYDKNTGVLLYGYSEFSASYVIEVSLANSTLITGSDNVNSSPGFTLMIPLTIFVTIGIIKKIKSKT